MEARTRNPIPPAPTAAADHFVRFYERDAALVDDVARYLRTGLNSGCAAITIATPSHSAAVEELWRSEGFDSRPARERGQLVVLDAAQTLEEIMEGAAPDPARFDAVVGGL